ncbi:MAG: hypothetical protein GY903_04845 [Fuerstiella sp.]|nr:hypothetical protein [Fuerstiella sp.]MCP4853802.1 hypothetical protein [Fuerstiella sp.]
MKCILSTLFVTVFALTGAGGVRAANIEKTLVSWVTLTDQNTRSGSILTIQAGPRFDGIIWAERAPGKWMAGSDLFSRTENEQDRNRAEQVDAEETVQLAIVYRGETVTIYRNGDVYASYPAQNIDLLNDEENYAIFGLRHIGGNGSIVGAIEDARIYDKALNQQEIKALEPNRESVIKPWAWWDFEGDKPAERTGRYAFNNLENGAKLENGKLVLKRGAVFVSARKELRATQPYVPFTPQMPDPVPETWLTYHLAHPGPDRAIPADPNCAIFYNGRYHLHYIFQNEGHSFAHLSSTDLVHWKWHPTTLTPPVVGHGMFSGTAFMTKEGKPAIIYHGQGSGRNQIAIAQDDNLEKWSDTIAVEPLTVGGKAPEMRHWDPDCWQVGDAYYALAGGSNPTVSKSKDLRTWEYLGELFHPDFPTNLGVEKGEDVSCANMFPIGEKWVLLCISHALGCRYYVGDFKDGRYLPEHHAMMNWARWDFFAPESLLTPDGRRVMWAWCTPWVNDMQRAGRRNDFETLMQGRIQPGVQSLPRELSLAEDGTLRIKPLRELEKLRTNYREEKNITVTSDTPYLLKQISGDALELEVVFAAPVGEEFGVNVLCGEDGKAGFPITYGAKRRNLTVDYIEPPFSLGAGEDLTLRIFVDKSMVEVFANDRQAAAAWHEYDPAHLQVSLVSKGGDVRVKKVTAWDMKTIYRDASK